MAEKLKILVTRPAHQAIELCKEISEQGNIPILFPTLEIIPPSDLSAFFAVIKKLDMFDIAIFTSANTLLFLPPLNKIRQTKIIAIGPSTAKALQQTAIKVTRIAPPPFTSEALLQLPEFQKVANKRIAIVTGAGSRSFLRQTLQQRGAEVQTIVAYQRQLPHNAKGLEKIQDIDIIAVTSQTCLLNLLRLAQQYQECLLTKVLLVISEKLAKLGKELGFAKVITAENATNMAVAAALQKYQSGTAREYINGKF